MTPRPAAAVESVASPKKAAAWRDDYDVIIVGARCAGAALATWLAREGARVLVVEKDRLHADQVLSTHTIHPPGFDLLDDLGVGAPLRAVTPPSRRFRLRKGRAHVDLEYDAGRAEHCPRRKLLDSAMQDVAAAAGAEIAERTMVTALTRSGMRVSGVRIREEGRGERDVRARVVVGADGRHSTVAREAEAPEYLGYDAPRAMYWGYWRAPDGWRDHSAYPFDMYVGKHGLSARVIFPTNDGMLLLGSLPPLDAAKSWRAEPARSLRSDLESDPVTAPLVGGRDAEEPVRGTVKERYYFRQGAGEGWALVGDAGHHKEFIVGDGITEALLQARSLAIALGKGTDRALEEWWRARDVAALPLFFFGQDEGRVAPPRRLEEIVFAHASESPSLRKRLVDVMEHRLSPYEAFDVRDVIRWSIEAALRGSAQVLRDFLAMGRRNAFVQGELRRRRKLLAETAGEEGLR